MRQFRFLVASLGVFVVGSLLVQVAAAAEETPRRLKILSYNIHHGEGTDGRIDLDRLAHIIRRTKPDLVALQEVDNGTRRTGRVDQTARLAELTGLKGRFAKQIDYEGGEYGQAFLSRFPLSDVQIHWLPGQPERERRIAAAVTVVLGARKLTFVSTHLHHADEKIRAQQAKALNTLFAPDEDPVLLAGDLNATPDSAPMMILGKHWKSATADESQAFTYPSPKPERQLDYVLYRPSGVFRVISAEVLEEPLASDHCPLLVEIEFQ